MSAEPTSRDGHRGDLILVQPVATTPRSQSGAYPPIPSPDPSRTYEPHRPALASRQSQGGPRRRLPTHRRYSARLQASPAIGESGRRRAVRAFAAERPSEPSGRALPVERERLVPAASIVNAIGSVDLRLSLLFVANRAQRWAEISADSARAVRPGPWPWSPSCLVQTVSAALMPLEVGPLGQRAAGVTALCLPASRTHRSLLARRTRPSPGA
jgi:hypothetical protein